MNDKIIHLAQRRPRALNLPDDVPVEPLETKGDELAIVVLRPDDAALWLSEDLSREQYNYVIDSLERARDKVVELRGAA